MSAQLHVYGACCAWHGPIEKVGHMAGPRWSPNCPPLPCCPFCSSPLYELPEDAFWEGARTYQKKGHANYVEFLKWLQDQPRCWRRSTLAAKAFTEATGKEVALGPDLA